MPRASIIDAGTEERRLTCGPNFAFAPRLRVGIARFNRAIQNVCWRAHDIGRGCANEVAWFLAAPKRLPIETRAFEHGFVIESVCLHMVPDDGATLDADGFAGATQAAPPLGVLAPEGINARALPEISADALEWIALEQGLARGEIRRLRKYVNPATRAEKFRRR
jgi:hypothetical protein